MAAQQNPLGLRLKAPEHLLRQDRLPSLKKRDLTLGGPPTLQRPAGLGAPKNAAPKPVFKPNLNVARTKNAAAPTPKDTTPRTAVKQERNRTRNNKRNDNVIQTQGLFSEGGATGPVKRASTYRSYSSRESSASEFLSRPVINKVEVKVDVEAENRHIKEILGEDDETELPDDGTKLMPISMGAYNHVKEEIKTETEGFEDFVKTQDSRLLLLQLPDTLPGSLPITKVEASPLKDDATDTSNTEFCTLRQIPEGQVGKLLKYRSGKMKLVLGENHVFDVTPGIDPGFLQEVVSIHTNPQDRSGSIINLGKINGKLIVTPDWTNLFDGKS